MKKGEFFTYQGKKGNIWKSNLRVVMANMWLLLTCKQASDPFSWYRLHYRQRPVENVELQATLARVGKGWNASWTREKCAPCNTFWNVRIKSRNIGAVGHLWRPLSTQLKALEWPWAPREHPKICGSSPSRGTSIFLHFAGESGDIFQQDLSARPKRYIFAFFFPHSEIDDIGS